MRIFLPLVLILLFVCACNNAGEKTADDSTKTSCKAKSLNPNGDSELAILMRQMATLTDSMKQALLSKRPLPPKPEQFQNMFTAQKTDSTINKSLYESLTVAYLAHVDAFYDAAPEHRVELFNAMVGACISCHENFCQGPIKRIQKLKIPQ